MATVSFDGAESVVNMTDPNLVAFGQAGPRSASFWSWTTPGGDEVQALGFGMQFDAAGRATAGTVTEVRIDAGNDNAGLLDIHASGLPSLPAAALDDRAQAFWNAVLGGSDTNDATGLAAAQVGGGFSILFGDDLASVLGSSLAFPTDEGGNDAFTMGKGAYDVMGDAARVAGNAGFRLFADYLGGDDTIAGGTTGLFNRFVGDAGSVGPNGRLGAGNDEITVDSGNVNSEVAGDTGVVLGSASGRATVVGGDDTLEGGSSSGAKLVGDAIAVDGFADVSGGDDFILDGDRGNELFGDVLVLRGNGTSTVRGGDDAVLGRGGNDRIAGDAGRIEGPGTLVGGDARWTGATATTRSSARSRPRAPCPPASPAATTRSSAAPATTACSGRRARTPCRAAPGGTACSAATATTGSRAAAARTRSTAAPTSTSAEAARTSSCSRAHSPVMWCWTSRTVPTASIWRRAWASATWRCGGTTSTATASPTTCSSRCPARAASGC